MTRARRNGASISPWLWERESRPPQIPGHHGPGARRRVRGLARLPSVAIRDNCREAWHLSGRIRGDLDRWEGGSAAAPALLAARRSDAGHLWTRPRPPAAP